MVWWSPIPVCSSDSPEVRVKHSPRNHARRSAANTVPKMGVPSAVVSAASDWIALSRETQTYAIFSLCGLELCFIAVSSIVGWAKGGRRQGRKKNWQSLKRDHASLMLAGHQCRCRSAPCTTLDNGLSNAPRFEAVSVLGCLSPSVPYTSVLFLTCRAAPLARNPLDR